MNRRKLLLGVSVVAVSAVIPAVSGTRIRSGTTLLGPIGFPTDAAKFEAYREKLWSEHFTKILLDSMPSERKWFKLDAPHEMA